ncbi:MAG: PKD domain-containing protein [Flavobacteriales bacterium]|nr:PKD domain-containing protein [Flavobacteriales bacterium]
MKFRFLPALALAVFTCMVLVVGKYKSRSDADLVRPQLMDIGHPGEYGPEDENENNPDKNRSWTPEEAQHYKAEFEKVRNSLAQLSARRVSEVQGSYAGGALGGNWVCRGPYNMPGTFYYTEMDEGTDTVYAVTNGHYGGVQFIWKGTLTGDDWTLINPKHPARFEDLIVLPKGIGRRVIAAYENGGIMYSDNSGKTWSNATGLPSSLKSTIVNRQDNNVIYATDGKKVYKSTDTGASFSEFQTIGSSASNARLYSPRWSSQPNASSVYLAVDAKFFKLNSQKTSFDQVGSPTTGGRIGIGGDSRKLWITLNNKKWYVSTNDGQTWTYQHTTSVYYNDIGDDMDAGHYPGVSPEDPNILIGGYTIPLTTRDAGVTTNYEANKYWGYYQNSVGNDPKVRTNYHPDFQGNQFFYDKDGKLMTLRSSDGGVFISYNEWTKTSYPNKSDIDGVYYNISLFDKPTQETYRGGFIYGAKNIDDMTTGTQDQGWQNTRLNSYGNDLLSWDQVGGGDGPCCITGDGLIGWRYEYFGEGVFSRIQLYNGTTYKGLSGTSKSSSSYDFNGGYYFTPSVGDWNNGDRIWVLSRTLRRMEYNTGTQQFSDLEQDPANSGDYVQGLAQSHVNPDVVYLLQDGRVFKSTNRGTSWSEIAGQSATGMSGSSQNKGMGWSSPNDEKIVLFASQSGTSVKTILSKDGGVTWKNVTGSGANYFPSAEVNGMAGMSDGSMVFASTNMGPYVFNVAEEKWYPLATDDDVPVFWGQIVYCVKYGSQEVARFSTWGQGIWDFNINAITASFTASTTRSCDGMVSFTDQSTGATNWSWDFGDGGSSSTQNPTHTYTSNGTYTVKLTVDNGSGSSDQTTQQVDVYIMSVPTANGVTICSGDSAALNASGSTGVFEWYDDGGGNNRVGEGTTWVTPALTASQTYYVCAKENVASGHVGPADTLIGTGGMHQSAGYGLLFDALQPFRLKSVYVYAGSAGERAFTVKDGNGGNVIASGTVNLHVGGQRVLLDLDIPQGAGRFLQITSDTIDLYRNTTGGAFPYSYGGLVSITGTNAPSVDYYYYFYDWEVEAEACRSDLVPVQVTVNPGPGKPVVTESNNILTSSVSGTTYQWYLNGQPISGANAQTCTPLADGDYTVEVTGANGCSDVSDIYHYVYTGIPSAMENGGIRVFPNPGNGVFVISSSQNLSSATLDVMDHSGRKIRSLGNGDLQKGMFNVDLTMLPAGIYFVVLRSEGTVWSGRLVKN